MPSLRAASATVLALAILGGLVAFTCTRPDEVRREVRAAAKAVALHVGCRRFSLLSHTRQPRRKKKGGSPLRLTP